MAEIPTRKKTKGGFPKLLLGPIGITLLAAALWGLSGTAAQILFQKYAFPPFALVTIRSLLAGMILLLWFRPKWPKERSWRLIKYAILGILPSQIFYFVTIAYSNIVTALLLEYMFLPMVVIYEGLTGRFRLNALRLAMLSLTVAGILLVVLGGGGELHLSITPIALIAGILSAFGTAYYNLFSRDLTDKYDSWTVTAWSFLIVGLVATIPGVLSFAQMAPVGGTSNVLTILLLVLIVAIFGTLLAYGLLLLALRRLSATEVSVVATTEPVFAAVMSFLVFGALLSGLQYFGGALMLLAVLVLKLITPEEKKVIGPEQ